MANKTKKTAKSSKFKAPTVRVERGERLPAVDIKAKDPLLYFRLPERLRTPQGSEKGLYQPVRSRALSTVQENWWQHVPRDLADTHLSEAFAGKKLAPQASGGMQRWVTVRGIGSPSGWNPQQKEAWTKYENALAQSVVTAEKDWHKEIDQSMKKEREAEKARKIREREAEKERKVREREAEKKRKIREREAAEVALAQSAENWRAEEWERAVQEGTEDFLVRNGVLPSLLDNVAEDAPLYVAARQYGEERASFQQGLASPSRAPVVQAHRRQMARKVAERQQRETSRFSLLDVDPVLSKPQAVRTRLADTLRADYARAITPEERRRILPRLRRAEAGVRRDELRRLSPEKRAAWEKMEQEKDTSVARRISALSIDTLLPNLPNKRRTGHAHLKRQPRALIGRIHSLPSPSRVSPARMRIDDDRTVEEQIASPRGRYTSPTAVAPAPLPQLPMEIAQRVDAEAHERAMSKVGPMVDRGDYAMGEAREWRQRFDREYTQAKRELWLEAAALLKADELSETGSTTGRFGLLEID